MNMDDVSENSQDDYLEELSVSEQTENSDVEEEDEEEDEEIDPEKFETKQQTEIEKFKKENGKIDNKQSVIYTSTKHAFVDYLKQVTGQKTTPVHQATIDKDQVSRVIEEMITARGFDIIKPPLCKQNQKYKSLLSSKKQTIIGVKQAEILCVFFGKPGKLGVQAAREIEKSITKYKISQVLIVTEDGVTPVAVKSFANLPCIVHFFETHELRRNYIQHSLIPKQRMLTIQESERFEAERKNLPRMHSTDPVAKYYGWPVGSIIECYRGQGQGTEPYIYRRLII